MELGLGLAMPPKHQARARAAEAETEAIRQCVEWDWEWEWAVELGAMSQVGAIWVCRKCEQLLAQELSQSGFQQGIRYIGALSGLLKLFD